MYMSATMHAIPNNLYDGKTGTDYKLWHWQLVLQLTLTKWLCTSFNICCFLLRRYNTCAVFNRAIHCEDIPGVLKIINNYYKASCQRSSLLYIRPSKRNYQTCDGRKSTRSDTRAAMGLGVYTLTCRILAGWPLRNSATAIRPRGPADIRPKTDPSSLPVPV